jgi:hypothetical protein
LRAKVAFMTEGDLAERRGGIAALAEGSDATFTSL